LFNNGDHIFSNISVVDAVIHLAYRNGFQHTNESHIEDLPKHYSLLKAAIDNNCKSITIMGSMHEVGYIEGEINENTECKPLSLYGICKNSLREMITLYANENNVSLKWLRGFYIVGDDVNSKSVFSKILLADQKGEKFFPFTDGKNKYDFLDISDAAKYIALCATQSKVDGIINICSGHPVSIKEKAEEFIKNNKLKIKLQYGVYPSRMYDSPIVYGNTNKLNMIIDNNF
jgi:dTDP-6-deoxy-L-talose 4-dehydrogenase (NAD+)